MEQVLGMIADKSIVRMPELPVFARSLAIGLICAEVWRAADDLGKGFAQAGVSIAPWLTACGAIAIATLCIGYLFMRGAHGITMRMARSYRIDLLIAVGIGIWLSYLISPSFVRFHEALRDLGPRWAPAILLLLCVLLASPLFRRFFQKPRQNSSQLYFLSDEEINDAGDDLFASEKQARSFAEAVLESSAHQGLIFGIDAPWGVGKTSFVNLVSSLWEKAEDRVIVCRFEPLRYASEPDLADRMIRDVSAAIHRKVFAPEFRPVVSRYARLIKGKADISFLGFKISMEPSQGTADELLEDIDQVLKRIGRRVIIVIDDLDRLDSATINKVLFATRRILRLSQATYVLCYDTEVIAGAHEETARARNFLEKFVTVKLSLFVDSSKIRDFLRRDWQREENKMGSIPSDVMLKLGAILTEAANILDGDLAAKYLPLLGDMRKVKRFVNAMLLMQLEKANLGRMDLNERDLINLVLLHLNYPGIFRRIYSEETEGRRGFFSVRRKFDAREFSNTSEFIEFLKDQDCVPKFLLTQLFDVNALGISATDDTDEADLASRACFNHGKFRALERYLKLIVRFVTPEPRETFVLYDDAVQRVRKGEGIASILKEEEFSLNLGEQAHDQFWSVLVNQSHDLSASAAGDAINTLVEYLPRYSTVEQGDRGLRQRSIYSLLRLLDRAGWGRRKGRRLPNTPENVVEIAWWIYGEGSHEKDGLIERLVAGNRGVLGWNDLMLFRLHCSADRMGQLYNLQSALILDQDSMAPTSGAVDQLAVMGLRKLSQEIFGMFQRDFIEPGRNFHSEVDSVSEALLLGEAWSNEWRRDQGWTQPDLSLIAQRVAAARTIIKSFVIYQLSNAFPPTGSGVGCGYYDEVGDSDNGSISASMNEYVFNVCFAPAVDGNNVLHFLDHCLSHLSSAFFSGGEEDRYVATRNGITGGLDPNAMGIYWKKYRDLILDRAGLEDRKVVTGNYIASYRDDLASVFKVLDELASDAIGGEHEANGFG